MTRSACCNDRGYYLDTRCLRKVCDHRTVKMRCPKRPCKCPEGRTYRLGLLVMIRKQTRRLKKLST